MKQNNFHNNALEEIFLTFLNRQISGTQFHVKNINLFTNSISQIDASYCGYLIVQNRFRKINLIHLKSEIVLHSLDFLKPWCFMEKYRVILQRLVILHHQYYEWTRDSAPKPTEVAASQWVRGLDFEWAEWVFSLWWLVNLKLRIKIE